MERIVKGYWDCPYCDSAGIDGLVDNCPNCGTQKPKTIKYYMKQGMVEYVSDEELVAAGIAKEECDGEHKDWICNYCDQLNDYSETHCSACGAVKSAATHEYGMVALNTEEPDDADIDTVLGVDTEELTSLIKSLDEWWKHDEPRRARKARILKTCGIIGAVFASLCLIAFLFYPLKQEISITGVSWERTVTVEEERTIKESGWDVPSGGRVYDEKEEFRKFVQVIDHYETVEETKTREVFSHYETVNETKSRQVVSHYETEYSYRDNGNGTFSEISHQKPVYKTETYTESHQKPVYKTETYTETHQEPVYRQDPVYNTKYYYEIERWFDIGDYATNGSNHDAYWSNAYELKSNQRDTDRSEKYMVHYSDGSSNRVNYNDWSAAKIGSKFIITYNRLGITYSKEKRN